MKGILFTPDMIKATVELRKTQTRRVIKPPPETGYEVRPGYYHPSKIDKNGDLYPGEKVYGLYSMDGDIAWKARYQPGEVVYIKEAWMLFGFVGTEYAFIHYKIDKDRNGGERVLQRPLNKPLFPKLKWKSPRFMPAWAARYFITIEDVRAERLQKITIQDVIAEGILAQSDSLNWVETTIGCYRQLWDSINKPPQPVYKRNESGKRYISHYESYPWEEGTYVTEYRGKKLYVYGNPWVNPYTYSLNKGE